MQLSFLLSALDVTLVAIFLYYIFVLLRGTQAASLLRGLVLMAAVYSLARILGLQTVNWLFDKFSAVILVLLIIVFQPELRRALEQLGRGRISSWMGTASPINSEFIRPLIRALEALSQNKTGAIMVIEKNTGLNEYIESGVVLDAQFSSELIVSLFERNSVLHDGAVVIRGGRIFAAGCLLPLSSSKILDKKYGTRHRAAVGITELADCLVIVVSESTGIISIAENGYLTHFETREPLEEKLFSWISEKR